MRLSVFGDTLAKKGATLNEDAYYPKKIEKAESSFSIALCDGASGAIFSGQWAQAMAREAATEWAKICKEEFDPQKLTEKVRKLGARFQPLSEESHFFARHKFAQVGSQSTLLLVSVEPSAPNGWTVWAVALGDSCLVKIDTQEKRVIDSFPFRRSEEFSQNPRLISNRPENSLPFEHTRWRLEQSEILLMASDALAKWILEMDEHGRSRNVLEDMLPSLLNPARFREFIFAQRENKRCPLWNDDVSLLALVPESVYRKVFPFPKSAIAGMIAGIFLLLGLLIGAIYWNEVSCARALKRTEERVSKYLEGIKESENSEDERQWRLFQRMEKYLIDSTEYQTCRDLRERRQAVLKRYESIEASPKGKDRATALGFLERDVEAICSRAVEYDQAQKKLVEILEAQEQKMAREEGEFVRKLGPLLQEWETLKALEKEGLLEGERANIESLEKMFRVSGEPEKTDRSIGRLAERIEERESLAKDLATIHERAADIRERIRAMVNVGQKNKTDLLRSRLKSLPFLDAESAREWSEMKRQWTAKLLAMSHSSRYPALKNAMEWVEKCRGEMQVQGIPLASLEALLQESVSLEIDRCLTEIRESLALLRRIEEREKECREMVQKMGLHALWLGYERAADQGNPRSLEERRQAIEELHGRIRKEDGKRKREKWEKEIEEEFAEIRRQIEAVAPKKESPWISMRMKREMEESCRSFEAQLGGMAQWKALPKKEMEKSLEELSEIRLKIDQMAARIKENEGKKQAIFQADVRNERGFLEFVHRKTGMRMVLIHAGAHGPITVESDFLAGKYEVTEEEWGKAMKKEGPGEGKEYPVTRVSWNESMLFCQKVGMRLLSSQEWEVVARAGKKTKFLWGDRQSPSSEEAKEVRRYAWCSSDVYHRVKGKRRVGLLHENEYGLHDTIGNVWEWVDFEKDGKKGIRGGSGCYDRKGNVYAWETYGYDFYGQEEANAVHEDVGFRCAFTWE